MARTPREFRSLEARLRNERPEPSAELMRKLAPNRSAQRPRFALAMAMTAALLVALAAVGGVSYAASALKSVARSAAHAVSPSSHQGAVVIRGLSAGGDQYRPGYGFGDPNHNHSGPPGLEKGAGNGEKAPPTQTTRRRKYVLVKTSITSDEQAALYFSVVDKDGNRLLLTQRGSKIGAGLHGRQVKSIHYVMLVPRTIPFALRVPSNLLKKGETYRIRVIAVDAQGNRSTLFIPFTA